MTDRHAIGGNNPPPHLAFEAHVQDLFETVSGSTASAITTDEQEDAIADILKTVGETIKDADAQRVAEKKPHDDAAKAVQANWKPIIDKLKAAQTELKNALTPYRTAKQAAKDKAAREAREKAEAERLAAQAELKAADDLEARFAAEEKLKQSAKLEAAANRIDRAPTGLRTRQIAVVQDHRAALLWIAKNDSEAMNAFIDEYARKRGAPFDGVVMQTESKAA